MAKKKTMKNIKTSNKFEGGGPIKVSLPESFFSVDAPKFTGLADTGSKFNGTKPKGNYLDSVAQNAGVTSLATGAGSMIAGDYTTDNNVGEWMQAAGAAASFIPGPVGMALGAALGLAGGIAERGFGTAWNQEGVAKAENNLNSLKGFQSGATSYDALMSDIGNINKMNTTVKASDLGKDGWWSNKTQDKAAKLNKKTTAAYNIAMRNAYNTADNIAADTLANLERNYAAFGGPLFAYGGQTHGSDFTNGLMFINNGGTHESNPYEGVPISMDQEGNPNLVEEGEVIWNDYVFSNRLKVPKSIQKKYKLGKREMTFANAVDKLSKESEERPNDPISIRGLESMLTNMAIEQETLKVNNKTKTEKNKFKDGGLSTWMRYAPVVGQGALALTDSLRLTNQPDYENANAVIDATKKAATYTPVGFKPIGDYMKYNPFDTEYYANQLRAESGTTRRNIMNTSGGNRATAMAGLLSADYNANNSLGDLYRKAAEYNLEQRQKVADFNRATNITNSEGLLKAAMANQSAEAQAKALGLEGLMTGYKMKEQAKLTSDQARAANISGLLQSIGDIGNDNLAMNIVKYRMDKGIDGPGTESYMDDITGPGLFDGFTEWWKNWRNKKTKSQPAKTVNEYVEPFYGKYNNPIFN